MVLVIEIYTITSGMPYSELYGLTNQLRRYPGSIPGNIAEGYGRNATGDYKPFLQIAVGSLFELQTQIEIAYHLKYVQQHVFKEFLVKTNELEIMMLSLFRKIN